MNDNEQYFESIIPVNNLDWRDLLKNTSNIEKIKSAGNYTLLHQAAHYNNYEAALFLIEDCRWNNLNILDEQAKTPLIVAANYGSTEIAKLLIDKGADYSLKDSEEMSPLFYACSRFNIDLITYLIDKGANPNEQFQNGETPLMKVIRSWKDPKINRIPIIEYLISHGADVNKPNDWGYTPIIYCINAEKPRIEIVNYLIGKGANKNPEMQPGRTIIELIGEIKNTETREEFKALFLS